MDSVGARAVRLLQPDGPDELRRVYAWRLLRSTVRHPACACSFFLGMEWTEEGRRGVEEVVGDLLSKSSAGRGGAVSTTRCKTVLARLSSVIISFCPLRLGFWLYRVNRRQEM